jgi:serine/threonine protein phosphatase PrpC
MALQTCQTLFFIDSDMESVELHPIGPGNTAIFSARCPGREGPNQDAAAVIPVADDHCVLVISDGFGGHPAGAQAAETAVRQIERFVCEHAPGGDNMRSAIVDGFERANVAVREMGVGAATTLAVVDIESNQVRSYHVGDSAILVVGQRGRIKMRSVAHSPVGYAVESGLIDEEEAMNHVERHVVSNMVGSAEMRIEIGPNITLTPRDTVLLGSDGLWDNMMFDDVVEQIRKGPIEKSLGALSRECLTRMTAPSPDNPSKPDDLTTIAFRPAPGR